MAAPAWLTARPIAHRGLHDRSRGVIENTLEAAQAAMARSYAIECDVTLSADGEAMVFHDDDLDRLVQASGPVRDRSADALGRLAFREAPSRMPTFGALLAAIGGRVPLVCEIKSRFDGELALAGRAAEVANGYAGPLAFKSFDPEIVAALAGLAPGRPRGFVAETRYDDPEWAFLPAGRLHAMRNLLDYPRMRPDFLSWYVKDLDTAGPFLGRCALGLPVMTWTVRTPEDRARAALWADQIVFEGFLP